MNIFTSSKSNSTEWSLIKVIILLIFLLPILYSSPALSARNTGGGLPPGGGGNPGNGSPPGDRGGNPDNDPYGDIEPDIYGIHKTKQGFDWISFSVFTRPGTTNQLSVKHGDNGSWIYLRSLRSGASSFREEGLDTRVKRCYKVTSRTNSSIYQYQICKIPNLRIEFRSGEMSQEISDRILTAFKWSKTRPVPVGNNPNQPALYYMAALVGKDTFNKDIRDLGIHIQDLPLFPDEFPTWDSQNAVVTVGDDNVKVWRFIVIPGYLYNAIRDRNIIRESRGDETNVLVFRRIPEIPARDAFSNKYRFNYPYLRDNYFTYNGKVTEDSCLLDESQKDCNFFLGGFFKSVISYFAEGAEFLIDGVRRIHGYFKRQIKGDVELTLNIELLNTQSDFIEPMTSGWSGKLLTLEGATVQIRQGFAIFNKKINDKGVAKRKVTKHGSTKICFQLKNHAVEITEFLTEKTVCLDGRYNVKKNIRFDLDVKHPYVNSFAAMFDAHKYMEEVMGYKMRRVRVLTGWQADVLAVEDDTSYAPCFGLVDLSALGALGPIPLIIQNFVQLGLDDIDIVLSTKDAKTRGVPVHEYGHIVLCSMARDVNGEAYLEIAWTDIILGLFNQNASNSSWVFNEAFADFISSQVLGATNYVKLTNSKIGGMYYPSAGSEGLEKNFTDLQNPDLEEEVARVASIFHDFFDGNGGNSEPNDGTHWGFSNGIQWDGGVEDSDLGDEQVSIPGSSFTRWAYFAKKHSFLSFTFNYKNWLGGLADLARDEGYSDSDICDVFELHSMSKTCPNY